MSQASAKHSKPLGSSEGVVLSPVHLESSKRMGGYATQYPRGRAEICKRLAQPEIDASRGRPESRLGWFRDPLLAMARVRGGQRLGSLQVITDG